MSSNLLNLPYARAFEDNARVLLVCSVEWRAQAIVKKLVRLGMVGGMGKPVVRVSSDDLVKPWRKTLRGATVSVQGPDEPSAIGSVLVLGHGVAEPKCHKAHSVVHIVTTMDEDDGTFTNIMAADHTTDVSPLVKRLDLGMTSDELCHIAALHLSPHYVRALCFDRSGVSMFDLEQPVPVTDNKSVELAAGLGLTMLPGLTSMNMVVGRRRSGKTTFVRRAFKADQRWDELHLVVSETCYKEDWYRSVGMFNGREVVVHETVEDLCRSLPEHTFEGSSVGKPLRVIMVDEVSELGSKALNELIVNGRSYNFSVWCIAQYAKQVRPQARMNMDRVVMTCPSVRKVTMPGEDDAAIQRLRRRVCREPGLAVEHRFDQPQLPLRVVSTL